MRLLLFETLFWCLLTFLVKQLHLSFDHFSFSLSKYYSFSLLYSFFRLHTLPKGLPKLWTSFLCYNLRLPILQCLCMSFIRNNNKIYLKRHKSSHNVLVCISVCVFRKANMQHIVTTGYSLKATYLITFSTIIHFLEISKYLWSVQWYCDSLRH